MTRPGDLSFGRTQGWLQRVDNVAIFSLRHGLAFLLAGLLLFTLLPFAAPLAMHAGFESLGNLLYTLYSPFCHQLPQRSWFLFGDKFTYTLAEIQQVEPTASVWELRAFTGTPAMGWKVAWSDRMISFYTLTPLFGLVFMALRRLGYRLAPLPWKVLLIALLPLALDGGTHAINDALAGVLSAGGFRDTNQWLAWLTAGTWPSFYAGDHFGTFNWWARLITGALAAWGIAFTVLPILAQAFEKEAIHATRQQVRGE